MTQFHNPKPTQQEIELEQYLNSIGVIFKAAYKGEAMQDNWPHYAWAVTFQRLNKKPLDVNFKTGMGQAVKKIGLDKRVYETRPHVPHPASVLHCIQSDASLGEDGFQDFCDTLGLNTDSRKALASYLECQEQASKLRAFFGADERARLEDFLADY